MLEHFSSTPPTFSLMDAHQRYCVDVRLQTYLKTCECFARTYSDNENTARKNLHKAKLSNRYLDMRWVGDAWN